MAVELFLALNDLELVADDQSCVVTMLKLAEGALSESEFANWIRINTKPAIVSGSSH
jgi:death-on-curing protein